MSSQESWVDHLRGLIQDRGGLGGASEELRVPTAKIEEWLAGMPVGHLDRANFARSRYPYDFPKEDLRIAHCLLKPSGELPIHRDVIATKSAEDFKKLVIQIEKLMPEYRPRGILSRMVDQKLDSNDFYAYATGLRMPIDPGRIVLVLEVADRILWARDLGTDKLQQLIETYEVIPKKRTPRVHKDPSRQEEPKASDAPAPPRKVKGSWRRYVNILREAQQRDRKKYSNVEIGKRLGVNEFNPRRWINQGAKPLNPSAIPSAFPELFGNAAQIDAPPAAPVAVTKTVSVEEAISIKGAQTVVPLVAIGLENQLRLLVALVSSGVQFTPDRKAKLMFAMGDACRILGIDGEDIKRIINGEALTTEQGNAPFSADTGREEA